MRRTALLLLLVLSVAAALAAPSFAATNPAQKTFSSSCSACHTLAAAKAKGVVGPNLDKTKPKYALVVARVTNGKGAMPSFKSKLTKAQIAALSKWITTHYKK